jgi:hypothetical protein
MALPYGRTSVQGPVIAPWLKSIEPVSWSNLATHANRVVPEYWKYIRTYGIYAEREP